MLRRLRVENDNLRSENNELKAIMKMLMSAIAKERLRAAIRRSK
jgi:hypothetical protein